MERYRNSMFSTKPPGGLPNMRSLLFLTHIFSRTHSHILTFSPTYSQVLIHVFPHTHPDTATYSYIHTLTHIHPHIPTHLPIYFHAPTYELPFIHHTFSRTHLHIPRTHPHSPAFSPTHFHALTHIF